jgi:membrane-associated phospholipid phosphatase
VTTTLEPALELDRRLLRLMRESGHADARVVRAIASFSRTGEHAAVWFALGALGTATTKRGSPRNRAFRRGIVVTAVAYGLNTAIKFRVERPRPELEDLPPLTPVVTGLSFPSAHATTSFAAAAAYSRALPLASPLFYGAATMFALSRPYLGVHYPSDVLAGTALGTVTGRLLRCR